MVAAVDQNLVQKAIDQVDRDRLIKLVMDLVDIPSPTGYEGDVAKAVVEELKRVNFDSSLQPVGDDRYNALGRWQGQGGGKSLMFNGHLDTSFGPEQAHRGLGYQCKGTLVDDEWIYGMGSFNMKSAMATYIVACEALQKAGIKLGGDVVISGVAGEIEKAPVNDHEGPMYQGYGVGTKFAITHGAIADMCILGEPTNLMAINQHCGSCWVKITVPGHLIHTAWSEVDKNAINKSRKVLDAIHDWIPDYCKRNKLEDGFMPRVNVSAVEAGWSWRGARTPDNCVIYMDVRTLPDKFPLEAYNEVRAMVDAVVAKNPELEGTKVETFMTTPGTSIPLDHELMENIKTAHKAQLGKEVETGTEVWMSDAAHMNRYGIPTVNYGSAGRIRTGGGGFSTHQGEAVHIGDMLDMIKVYIQIIMQVCGVVK